MNLGMRREKLILGCVAQATETEVHERERDARDPREVLMALE